MPAASAPMASLARAFFLLTAIVIGSRAQSVDQACTINGGPGICKVLPQCSVVYNALLAGNPPEKLCGFQGFDPVVCCPTAQPTPRPTAPTPGPPSGPVTVGPFTSNSRRGNVARAKCAEYAQSVYGLELPPILSAGKQVPVNVSRCAIKQRKLIVGGTRSDPKEFPHMTAIGYNTDNGIGWLCGGTLISERFVLTAAHCMYSDWGDAVVARVGDLNLRRTDDDAKPQNIRIIQHIQHPEYKHPSGYHDIGVFKLERDVEFSAYIRPACLPYSLPDIGTANKALATGWGRVDWSDEEGSDDLLKVTLNLVDNASCNRSFVDGVDDKLKLGIVEDWQICAGQFGKDTCQGDSGGPLSIFNDDQTCMYSVIGVTSLGRICGSIIPGVYTRVYYYLPWLESVVWPQGA